MFKAHLIPVDLMESDWKAGDAAVVLLLPGVGPVSNFEHGRLPGKLREDARVVHKCVSLFK